MLRPPPSFHAPVPAWVPAFAAAALLSARSQLTEFTGSRKEHDKSEQTAESFFKYVTAFSMLLI